MPLGHVGARVAAGSGQRRQRASYAAFMRCHSPASSGHSLDAIAESAENSAILAPAVQHSRRAPSKSPWNARSRARSAAACWPDSIANFTPRPLRHRGRPPRGHWARSISKPLSGPRRWNTRWSDTAIRPERPRDQLPLGHRSIGVPRSGRRWVGGCPIFGPSVILFSLGDCVAVRANASLRSRYPRQRGNGQ